MHCTDLRKRLPTFWLTMATLSVTVLLITPAAYQNTMVNQPQQILMAFTNASFESHYGHYMDTYSLDNLWGFIAAVSAITAVPFGLALSSIVAYTDTKTALFLIGSIFNALCAVSECVAKYVGSFELFTIGQVLGPGIGWTCAFGLAPVYLSECSPPALRGMTGNMVSFGYYLGILLSYLLGLSELLGTANGWAFYAVWTVVPALAGFALFFVFPHSPKYLYINKENPAAAADVIRKFYGTEASVDECFREYDDEATMTTLDVGIREVLREYHLRRGLLIAAVAQVFSFACGPMVTMSYSTMIFVEFLPQEVAQMATVVMAAPLPFLALLSSVTIERYGRRPLLLYGGLATQAALVVYVVFGAVAQHTNAGIWASYASAAGIVLNMWVSPFGPLPIGLFLVSELTPQQALATSSAACVVISACMNVVQTYVFPTAQQAISFWAVLIVLVAPSCACLVFLWVAMPETRGKPVNEIVNAWISTAHKDALVLKRGASFRRHGRAETVVGGRRLSITDYTAVISRKSTPVPIFPVMNVIAEETHVEDDSAIIDELRLLPRGGSLPAPLLLHPAKLGFVQSAFIQSPHLLHPPPEASVTMKSVRRSSSRSSSNSGTSKLDVEAKNAASTSSVEHAGVITIRIRKPSQTSDSENDG